MGVLSQFGSQKTARYLLGPQTTASSFCMLTSRPTKRQAGSTKTGSVFRHVGLYLVQQKYTLHSLFSTKLEYNSRLNNNGEWPPPIYMWGRSFFSSPAKCTNHTVETANQISMKFCGYHVRLKLVRPFIRNRQVVPNSQIALPVLITQLQWPQLPGLWFSCPIGLAWDLTIDYVNQDYTASWATLG